MLSSSESKENDEVHHVDVSAFKIGQKYPTPSPGNGDRVFYETLLRQRPNSEMAQDWCLAYGVLDVQEAEKLFDYVQKRKKKGNIIGSPPRKNSSTVTKKRSRVDHGDDGETFVILSFACI